jgi:hypothetical protein
LWSVQFTARRPDTGEEKKPAGLCCLQVSQLPEERGLALFRGQTGDIKDSGFTDFVCAGGGQRLYFEATAPFEILSGHEGVVPGPDTPTKGSRAVFCTDGSPESIRGKFKNDLGAFDLFDVYPVPSGSLLATKSGGRFEGSVSNDQGSFVGVQVHTTWEGRCQSGACALTQRRPKLKVLGVSAASLLNYLLTRGRGTGLVLEKDDGTRRVLRMGQTLDLEAGDVVTAHGIEAEVELVRPDDTVVKLLLYPLAHIKAGGDPRIIFHRGGKILAGSPAGFEVGSNFVGPSGNAREGHAATTATTTVTNGRVELELAPGGRRLVVRSLAGNVQVAAGGAALPLAPGKDALATPAGVRALPPAPDLARLAAGSRVISAGPVSLATPPQITTRSLSVARCLGMELRSRAPARALVSVLVGSQRRGRVVAQRLELMRGLDARRVCLPLSAQVRALPAGTPLTLALGTRAGTRRQLALRRVVIASG